jgi:GT2 family glycosyltransferase
MTADAPDLSIVLVNWNACELTSAALASLASETRGIASEIFVVDNGTTRDAGVVELQRRFPAVAFIANASNMGFSVANNQGIARARGRYVLLLNNDTVQIENALAAAVAYMDGNPTIGALGILHRNADAQRSPQASAFAFPRPWREVAGLLGIRWGTEYGVPLPTDAECDVDWVCGSFLMMRRACLEQVGPLDERFFIYDEDID